MSGLEEILAQSLTTGLLIIIIILLLMWLFIKSAVKAGTKKALIEFYQENIIADKIKQQKDDDFKKEMDGWT